MQHMASSPSSTQQALAAAWAMAHILCKAIAAAAVACETPAANTVRWVTVPDTAAAAALCHMQP